MNVSLEDEIISKTKSWIKQVVIGLNFCPFAAQPFNDNSIHYKIINSSKLNIILEELIRECNRMDADEKTDTSLLILPTGWGSFITYLILNSYLPEPVKMMLLIIQTDPLIPCCIF